MISIKQIITSTLSTIFFCGAPLAAQNVVGTTVVDGREVTLYQDQTWAFKQASTEKCEQLTKFLNFCGDPFVWRKNPPPNQAILAQYTPDPQLYLQYIPENVGSNAGINYDIFRQGILRYAGNASGVTAKSVPVLLSGNVVVSGLEGKTLVYIINVSGMKVVFQNTMIIQDDWALQIQTYETGVTNLTEKHKKHHADSIALTELSTV